MDRGSGCESKIGIQICNMSRHLKRQYIHSLPNDMARESLLAMLCVPCFVAIVSLWYNMVGHTNVYEQLEN